MTQPETQDVLVISGNSSQDKFLKEQAQRELKKYEGKVRFTYLNDVSMDELKAKTASLPPRTVVLYIAFFLDNQGNSFSGPKALSLFAPTANAPIYGISETYLGVGIVNGSLVDYRCFGRTVNLVCACWPAKLQNIVPQTVPRT
jgi:hypothetical protein